MRNSYLEGGGSPRHRRGILPLDTWVHLSLSRSGTRLYTHKDGVLVSTATIPATAVMEGPNTTSAIVIGTHLSVARYLLGEWDEQALWAAAKSADDHLERLQSCQAHYFLGEAVLSGVLPGHQGSSAQTEARRHFEAALATNAFHQPTYNLADARLEQLSLPELVSLRGQRQSASIIFYSYRHSDRSQQSPGIDSSLAGEPVRPP